MSTFVKILFIASLLLVLVGSFLPWRAEGDFISYRSPGIQIYPSVKDNGGLLIVLLTLIVLILIFRPPPFLGTRPNWPIVFSIILALDAFFHIGKLLFDRKSVMGLFGPFGAPVIQVGLVMVLVGSLFLLFSVVAYSLKPQL